MYNIWLAIKAISDLSWVQATMWPCQESGLDWNPLNLTLSPPTSALTIYCVWWATRTFCLNWGQLPQSRATVRMAPTSVAQPIVMSWLGITLSPLYLIHYCHSSAGDVENSVNLKSRINKAIHHLIINSDLWKLTHHWHYHIALGTVGRRLEDFKWTQEFTAAMCAALKGKIAIFLAVSQHNLTHIIAYKAIYKINILHWDISPGNILIPDPNESDKSSEDGNKSKKVGSLLINWNLLKVVDPVNEHSTAC